MFFVKIKRIIKTGFINFWRNGWVSLATILVMVIAFALGSASFVVRAEECPECEMGGSNSENNLHPDNSLYQRFIFALPGGYVAAGVGMRNRGYGNITINVIPSGSTIEAAYLYWDILDNVEGPGFSSGKFNGVPIAGIKIGEGFDPCWLPTKNFAYRADVTNLVTGNGIYSLTDFSSGRTDGCDSWTCFSDLPLLEGVSLVVIYRNVNLPWQDIVVYDGAVTLFNNEYTHAITGFTSSSPVAGASITYIGADGQNGVGGWDYAEDTYFNGIEIADRDWDGSDPQAGPSYRSGNLWDTNTYDVTNLVNPGDTSAAAKVRSYRGHYGYADCLVWVATVFSVSTTLNVPKYYQNAVSTPQDPNWPDEIYDFSYLYGATTTIAKEGCALTSGVMVLRFHDVTTGPDPQNTPGIQLDVNPSTLNEWLKRNNGYLPEAVVNFESFKQYSDSRVFFTGRRDIEQSSLDRIISDIHWDLNTGHPVIIKTEYIDSKGSTTPHYVVAKGIKGDTWFINDPAFKTKTTLADYQNKILGIRTFGRGVGPTNRITFYIASPAELFLVDPLGRRTGVDPETKQFFSEIPESSYGEDQIGDKNPVKALDVMEPMEGKYQLRVVGTAPGSYSLTTRTEDQGGNIQQITVDGVIAKDVVSTFDVDYSSTPGIPTEIERTITIPDTINDAEISYELGWITKKFVRDILITKLKVAQRLEQQKEKQLRHFDDLIAKAKNPKVKQSLERAKENYEKAINKAIAAVLKSFIKEVEIYTKKGWITKQASEILIKDADYIIGHL